MGKIQYYLGRVVVTILLILGIMTFLFFAFRLMPGDYATLLAGEGADEETIREIRDNWGLDEPIYVQYFSYITNMLTGDAGYSYRTETPVWDTVSVALMNSLILALPALLLAFLIGTLYGALMGTVPGSRFEQFGIFPPTILGTTPDFFLGILLLLLLSSWLNVFPSGGMASIETYRTAESHWELYLTRDFAMHYILPFATIVLKYLYYPTLIMRSSVVEVRGQEFANYQRIVGIKRSIRFRDIMSHASLPVITVLPAVTATSISAQVLIEIVFNWPGIGKLLFDSVLMRDTPVIQFIFLMIAIWIIVGNLLVDIAYTLIDPRITYDEDS